MSLTNLRKRIKTDLKKLAAESLPVFIFLRVSLKVASKYCKKGLKYCKFTRARNKTKHVMKKDLFKR